MRQLFAIFIILLQVFYLNAQTNISGIINRYEKVLLVDFCNNKVVVESAVGYSVGDRVMLIQMSGATIDQTNTSAFGSITDYALAGNYEILTIGNISFNVITFEETMERYYDAVGGKVQLVDIPEYDNVIIEDEVIAMEWNGSKGGIVAFTATGTVTFNEDIDVEGQGFYGGDDYSHLLCYGGTGNYTGYVCNEAEYCGSRKGEGIGVELGADSLGRGAPGNGGGGGNDSNSGGGGGSNYGSGGIGGKRLNVTGSDCGGNYPGLGGYNLAYSAASNKIFMGGGGGSGDQNENDGTSGADGGGIVFIRAAEVIGNNFTIKAGGRSVFAVAGRDAAGGGGGGGAVIFDVPLVSSPINILLTGGDGGDVDNNNDAISCNGPGGGGGGGILILPDGALPANVLLNADGGAVGETINASAPAACNGSSNEATAGQAGGYLTDFVLAEPTTIFIPLTLSLDPEDITICFGESISITSTSDGTGTLTYEWNDYLNSITPDLSIVPNNSIAYALTVTDERDCQITKACDVTVIDSVYALAIPDATIILGEYVNLYASVIGVNYDYLWTPTDYNISDPTSATPVVNPFTTTTYCLEASDAQSGCIYNSCIEIQVINDVVIPNAFSPNGDGLNDVFSVPYLGDICNSITFFQVFDRWGQVVYDYYLDTDQNGWDGTHINNGQPEPIGNYIYLIKLDCDSGERIFANDVILLR
ncbi:MAG: gliding motility-associated C-terminal domain-containing protein [Chitinophagales bacterium]|nr:gliding motility-associated C-terminal domain-containing protein [Chitinophagales bacterium]MBP8752701.1 gliding motility-associated C-terminal domain-containing protein [Chitinophagales bacterium]MBP9190484.1 gliding motility-associated C-terminal domain-containing protein [Chitinophagales bacterium]MBP9705805.1 gliding motility-associated C-terminal domain-containing protein [Chitinophagales bacterium]